MAKTQSKTFVWKHKRSLNADLVLARKAGLQLLINCYTYFTHDRYDSDISLNGWFTAWGVACPEALSKDDGQQYSLEYLRIYTGKVMTVVEGGYSIKAITSIAKLEELCDRVNGKAVKKEMSELDKLVARIEKCDARTQRAIYKRLSKKFG